MELEQKMRVISKKESGEPGARDARPVAITGEQETPDDKSPVGSAEQQVGYSKSSNAGDWLIDLANESNKRLTEIKNRRKPRIQKVPEPLRGAGENRPLFEPVVVSLGPYYHGRPHLAAMEEHKRAAAMRYAGGQAELIRAFYDKVRAVAGEARECYADGFHHLSDDDFANMLFLDCCFILHFIDCFVRKDVGSLTMNAQLHGFITRDMFLLENQVPFVVLEALMSLKHVDYEAFTSEINNAGTTTTTSTTRHGKQQKKQKQHKDQERGVPIHLLDLLRTRLLGGDVTPTGDMEANWPCFRSVMELKEAGIKFGKSKTCCLRDVMFRPGRVYGQLSLPKIVVDDLTQGRFLNLIAFEMCPDSGSDYGVTSYVCFLDYLIDHAADVKELRRKGILLNALGSDQQVADLFNELATGLSPEDLAYSRAVMGINSHYNNKVRVSIVRMLHTHFSSPWATISFVAAVFLLALTMLQTFFTVFSKFAVDK